MFTRMVLTTLAATVALGAVAAPAAAMRASPAPVDDMAPAFSGHYDTPDKGQKGEARPWSAGPSWNR